MIMFGSGDGGGGMWRSWKRHGSRTLAFAIVTTLVLLTTFTLTQNDEVDGAMVGSGTEEDPFTELDNNLYDYSLINIYEMNESSTFYFERGTYVNIYPFNPDTFTLDQWGWIDPEFEGGGGLTREYYFSMARDVGCIVGNIEGHVSFDFMGDANVTFVFVIAGETNLPPFTAASGTGTEGDPYSGTLSIAEGSLINYADFPIDIWVEEGCVFDLLLETSNKHDPQYSYTLSADVGLNLIPRDDLFESGHDLSGTADTVGTTTLTITSNDFGTERQIAIHVVSGQTELVFLSDPTDPLFATITYSKP